MVPSEAASLKLVSVHCGMVSLFERMMIIVKTVPRRLADEAVVSFLYFELRM